MSAKMLYGLALETAFKAAIIRDYPQDVEFRLAADGSGTVHHVELKQVGVAMGSGHNLTALANKVGIFRREGNPVFKSESDFEAIGAILEDLGEITVWAGRYPVPKQSGGERAIPAGLPVRVLGHYMRDWSDLLLDYLHRPLEQPQSSPGVGAQPTS